MGRAKGNFPQLVKMSRLPLFLKVRNQRSMLYITNLCGFVRLMIVMFPCTCPLKLSGRMIPIVNEAFGNLTYDVSDDKLHLSNEE